MQLLQTSKDTKDIGAIQKAADFVQAFILGFEVEVGLRGILMSVCWLFTALVHNPQLPTFFTAILLLHCSITLYHFAPPVSEKFCFLDPVFNFC